MFSSDKPIEKMDADLLNRAYFAKQLAKAIMSYKNPDNFTIGLCGTWGSGKTSIINMAVEEIIELSKEKSVDEQMVIIHFNPWNYSDKNQLIGQFFQTIFTELKVKTESEKLKEAGDALEKYSGLLEYTTYIPGIGKYLSPLINLISNSGAKISDIAAEKASLSNQKGVVVDALSKQTQKILIIIDDIDRLNNDQIRLIFQLVNSVAGFPNIIYLLSFDKNVVVRALEDEQNCNGEEYLEKIIQVPFEIPETKRAQVQKLFFDRIDTIIEQSDSFDDSYLSSVFYNCISPFLNNVRDINRICNVFQFKYGLMEREVDWIDLLAITTIQICAPMLFDWIKNNQAGLTGNSQTAGAITGTQAKENREYYKNVFLKAGIPDAELAIRIVQTLFPRFGWITGQYSSGETIEDIQKKKRIASDRHLHSYFSLSLDEVAIPINTIEETITKYNCEQLRQFFEEISSAGALAYYLRELLLRVSEIPDDRVELFYDELIILQYDTPVDRGIFSRIVDPSYTGYDICFQLLKKLNKTIRVEKMQKSIDQASISTIFVNAKIIDDIEKAYGRRGNSMNSSNQLVGEDALSALEGSLKSALNRLAASDELFNNPRFVDLLPLWNYLDSESLLNYEKACVQSCENIPALLLQRSGYWHNGRDGGPTFKDDYFNEIISTDEIYKSIESIKGTETYESLSDNLKDITVAFYLWYNSKDRLEEHVSKSMIAAERRVWDLSTQVK